MTKASSKIRGFSSLVVFMIGLFLVFVASTTSSPPGSSADDSYHLPSIWCSQPSDSSLCKSIIYKNTFEVPSKIDGGGSLCYLAINGILERLTVPATCLTGIDKESRSNVSFLNQNRDRSLYPPLFYQISRLLVTDNVEISILSIRLFWSVVFLLFFGFLLMNSSPSGRGLLYLRFFFSMIPLGIFLVASTNPSSGAVISLFFYPNFLTLFIRRSAVWGKSLIAPAVIFLFILGAGSRSDAFIYLIVTSVAVVFLERKSVKAYSIFALLFPCILLSLSLVRTAKQASSLLLGLGGEIQDSLFDWQLLFRNSLVIHEYLQGFWGYYWKLGWKWEPPFPDTYSSISALLFLLALFYLYVKGGRSKRSLMVENARFTIGIVGILLVTFIAIYQHQIIGVEVGEMIQPRYLYPFFLSTTFFLFSDEAAFSRLYSTKSLPPIFPFLVILGFIGSLVLTRSLVRYVNGGGSHNLIYTVDRSWFWIDLSFGPLLMTISAVLGYSLILLAYKVNLREFKKSA